MQRGNDLFRDKEAFLIGQFRQILTIFTSSFRSCPIQLWIRGTIVLEVKMANITQPNRTNKENENYSFRCADAGFTGCSWEAKGSSPDDVLRQAEQHGREQHNMTSINDETRDKVRSKIRHAA